MSGAALSGERYPGYGSHLAFYEDVYAPAISRVRHAGRLGADIMELDQTRGDWSDAQCPDLLVSELLPGSSIEAQIDVGAGRFRTRSRGGAFLVTPPRSATTILIEHEHRLRTLAVNYAALQRFAGEDALPADGDFGPLHSLMYENARVSRVMEELWTVAARDDGYARLAGDGLLLQLCAALLAAGSRLGGEPAGLAPWRLKRAIDLLESRLGDDVTLEELARAVDLSPYHFNRQFRRSTGLPPHRWLQARRVERAKTLLAQPGADVLSVAAAVGYENPGHFAKLFRRYVGVSPSEFRRQL